MTLIKKRKCPECGGWMEAKLINLNYKKRDIEIEVEVIGIPANVCTRCFTGLSLERWQSILTPWLIRSLNQRIVA